MLEPEVINLPINVQQDLENLEAEFKEGDLTDKGYQKRRSSLIAPYLIPGGGASSADERGNLIEPELEVLPQHVVEQLEILKEELENEEITEKGYTKRRLKILGPFMLKEPSVHELPPYIQRSYKELDEEYEDGDLTEKGYNKKIKQLIKPFLIPEFTFITVHPSSYSTSRKKSLIVYDGDEERLDRKVVGIQTVMKDGQKLFKCEVCGEVFKQAQSFSGHCRLHRGERIKRFKCSICGSTYTTKSHLKFHMYKHSGNYPFTCSFCGKGFAGRSQHKYHVLRHTGETPFNCKDCGARFWKQENLDAHQRKQCISRSDDMPLTATDGATTPGDVMDVEVEGVQEEQDVPYVCTITEHCNEVFETQKELDKHMHVVHVLQPIEIQLEDESPTMTSSGNRNALTENPSIEGSAEGRIDDCSSGNMPKRDRNSPNPSKSSGDKHRNVVTLSDCGIVSKSEMEINGLSE
ncbi:zinc finger protein 836-like isoform X2 [Hydractinia symbiolongicarpus]|nr:zinc finger protein 836-like isoform X2 [Hydractinia symbiolongicarpus]XP_057309194.1 zinc finger protein 836-like isoform X2 [Hydractinia symbiolongicarpus]